jgi:hypothetical protein
MWPANERAAKPVQIASPGKPGSQSPFFWKQKKAADKANLL